jgi:hypothetical protein
MGSSLHSRWSIVAVLALAGALVVLPTAIATAGQAVPIISAPPNQTVDNDPGQPGATVNYPPPTVSGPPSTVACNPPSGSFFPIGTTTVTCTATTATGLTASAVFTVTVLATFPTTSPSTHHDGRGEHGDERDPAPPPVAQALVTTPVFTG